jgi:HTH-type transcriptional regulator / antitoxin HipB
VRWRRRSSAREHWDNHQKNRINLGLTQKELADLAGVGKTVVWNLENQAANTRIGTLDKILTVLNIDIEISSPATARGSEKQR